MKKTIIALSLGVMILTAPFAFAQTATSTDPLAGMTIQQKIDYLYQEVNLLIVQLQEILVAQQSLASQVSSTQAMVQSAPQSQILAGSSPVPSMPPRSYHVKEEAEIDFGSGFKRGVDVQNNYIDLNPGSVYSGKAIFLCFYDSYVAGLSSICTPQPSDESSLPSISSQGLTIQFDVLMKRSGTITKTIQATTDANGNFSFTAPSIQSLIGSDIAIGDTQAPYYSVTILNSGYFMLNFRAVDGSIKK